MNDNKNLSLASLCSNATNQNGDDFVGLRFVWDESKKNYSVRVKFPVGYRISEEDVLVRDEILQLMSILHKYGDTQSLLPDITQEISKKYNSFPIDAYRRIIYDYLNRGGYYQEYEEIYVSRSAGKVNWNRTIRKEKPIVQKNSIAYLTMQVRKNNYTDKNLITEISKYCVYESFLKLGWLYKHKLPPMPDLPFNKARYKTALNAKLMSVNQDSDKKLFQSMLDVVNFLGKRPEQSYTLYFGTNRFEYIWEKLIDNNFGVKDKQSYFPRAKWELYFNDDKQSSALQPDTVMKKDGIFVLDAKYYRYGATGNPLHLPNSSSINKQITYGEYIANNPVLNKQAKIYNAFLMPFGKNNSNFNTDANYLLIGTAKSDWKANENSYESVQGILIDTKHLMSIKPSFHDFEQSELSKTIHKGYCERIKVEQ